MNFSFFFVEIQKLFFFTISTLPSFSCPMKLFGVFALFVVCCVCALPPRDLYTCFVHNKLASGSAIKASFVHKCYNGNVLKQEFVVKYLPFMRIMIFFKLFFNLCLMFLC